jgi:HEAT repeat protein
MPDVEFHARKLGEAKDYWDALPHIKALKKMKTPKAVEALIKALKHEHEGVVWNSAFALGEIKDKRAVPALIKMLKHEDPNMVRNSIIALGKIRDKSAIPALIKALGHKMDGVRIESAHTLVIIGREAVPALIKALGHKNRDVAYRSAYALGELGDERALPYLMKHADHPDISVRYEIKKAIRKIRGVKDA